MRAETRTGRTSGQRYSELVVRAFGRWLRFFACYDSKAPWPRYGFWRTRAYEVRGASLRMGAKFPGPCVTVAVFWRRLRDDGQ